MTEWKECKRLLRMFNDAKVIVFKVTMGCNAIFFIFWVKNRENNYFFMNETYKKDVNATMARQNDDRSNRPNCSEAQ